jgi:RimJ/RimL family protein N-acetyltransferase
MVSGRESIPFEQPPEILGAANRAELLVFLSTEVCANLFQLCWLEDHGVTGPDDAQDYFFAGLRDRSGKLSGVTLAIGQSLLLIHCTHSDAAAALGRWFRRKGFGLDHIVSASAWVTPFWEAYASATDASPLSARLDRLQHLYVLKSEHWQGANGADAVKSARAQAGAAEKPRRANLDELDAVYLASARMHAEETGENPLDTEPEAFRRHVAHRIRTRRCFVQFDPHRRLLFKADISALSSFGAQISGVYTAPQFRGRGIATRALFDICGELFEGGLRRVTLYVNADNEAAHRVYRKVGFEFHAPYQTVFVEAFNP